jgi:hypothetical protein
VKKKSCQERGKRCQEPFLKPAYPRTEKRKRNVPDRKDKEVPDVFFGLLVLRLCAGISQVSENSLAQKRVGFAQEA